MPYVLSEIFDDYGNSLSKPTLWSVVECVICCDVKQKGHT